ncbi:hypothetical protein H696_04723 [Fonticula alba]|uniref:Uncharacterized protein n=1 Tax=Fonticula alba TaxID=691883 RepID=A0A058Z2D7_FONAL|nr:hypothetical protein H696_04723 [Fonticula alba]KCV68429.1 hypothetical protein H696_04723 [Fonticula alba]|eukprot:XP_009496861.1 hypothetical protein H696_04723 [Fonticula alba]
MRPAPAAWQQYSSPPLPPHGEPPLDESSLSIRASAALLDQLIDAVSEAADRADARLRVLAGFQPPTPGDWLEDEDEDDTTNSLIDAYAFEEPAAEWGPAGPSPLGPPPPRAEGPPSGRSPSPSMPALSPLLPATGRAPGDPGVSYPSPPGSGSPPADAHADLADAHFGAKRRPSLPTRLDAEHSLPSAGPTVVAQPGGPTPALEHDALLSGAVACIPGVSLPPGPPPRGAAAHPAVRSQPSSSLESSPAHPFSGRRSHSSDLHQSPRTRSTSFNYTPAPRRPSTCSESSVGSLGPPAALVAIPPHLATSAGSSPGNRLLSSMSSMISRKFPFLSMLSSASRGSSMPLRMYSSRDLAAACQQGDVRRVKKVLLHARRFFGQIAPSRAHPQPFGDFGQPWPYYSPGWFQALHEHMGRQAAMSGGAPAPVAGRTRPRTPQPAAPFRDLGRRPATRSDSSLHIPSLSGSPPAGTAPIGPGTAAAAAMATGTTPADGIPPGRAPAPGCRSADASSCDSLRNAALSSLDETLIFSSNYFAGPADSSYLCGMGQEEPEDGRSGPAHGPGLARLPLLDADLDAAGRMLASQCAYVVLMAAGVPSPDPLVDASWGPHNGCPLCLASEAGAGADSASPSVGQLAPERDPDAGPALCGPCAGQLEETGAGAGAGADGPSATGPSKSCPTARPTATQPVGGPGRAQADAHPGPSAGPSSSGAGRPLSDLTLDAHAEHFRLVGGDPSCPKCLSANANRPASLDLSRHLENAGAGSSPGSARAGSHAACAACGRPAGPPALGDRPQVHRHRPPGAGAGPLPWSASSSPQSLPFTHPTPPPSSSSPFSSFSCHSCASSSSSSSCASSSSPSSSSSSCVSCAASSSPSSSASSSPSSWAGSKPSVTILRSTPSPTVGSPSRGFAGSSGSSSSPSSRSLVAIRHRRAASDGGGVFHTRSHAFAPFGFATDGGAGGAGPGLGSPGTGGLFQVGPVYGPMLGRAPAGAHLGPCATCQGIGSPAASGLCPAHAGTRLAPGAAGGLLYGAGAGGSSPSPGPGDFRPPGGPCSCAGHSAVPSCNFSSGLLFSMNMQPDVDHYATSMAPVLALAETAGDPVAALISFINFPDPIMLSASHLTIEALASVRSSHLTSSEHFSASMALSTLSPQSYYGHMATDESIRAAL